MIVFSVFMNQGQQNGLVYLVLYNFHWRPWSCLAPEISGKFAGCASVNCVGLSTRTGPVCWAVHVVGCQVRWCWKFEDTEALGSHKIRVWLRRITLETMRDQAIEIQCFVLLYFDYLRVIEQAARSFSAQLWEKLMRDAWDELLALWKKKKSLMSAFCNKTEGETWMFGTVKEDWCQSCMTSATKLKEKPECLALRRKHWCLSCMTLATG